MRRENTLTGSKNVVDIFAEIDGCDDYITGGLQFTGVVVSPEKNSIYTLPYEYINQDDNGEYVNIYTNNQISKQYIETGIETEEYVEIKTQLPLNTIFIKENAGGKVLIENFE